MRTKTFLKERYINRMVCVHNLAFARFAKPKGSITSVKYNNILTPSCLEVMTFISLNTDRCMVDLKDFF